METEKAQQLCSLLTDAERELIDAKSLELAKMLKQTESTEEVTELAKSVQEIILKNVS